MFCELLFQLGNTHLERAVLCAQLGIFGAKSRHLRVAVVSIFHRLRRPMFRIHLQQDVSGCLPRRQHAAVLFFPRFASVGVLLGAVTELAGDDGGVATDRECLGGANLSDTQLKRLVTSRLGQVGLFDERCERLMAGCVDDRPVILLDGEQAQQKSCVGLVSIEAKSP